MKEWTIRKYKEMIREYQNNLIESDNLRSLARDILDNEEGLKCFLKEEMGESDPIGKIAYDLA